jgi:hypothetical protein
MAGLKKTKKDGTSPNLVLICFLIFFVLLSIGLGVFAYYGQEGQAKLQQEVKVAKAAEKIQGAQRKAWEFYAREAAAGIGLSALAPEETTEWKASSDFYRAQPDDYKDVDKWVKEVRKKNADFLGAFSEAELKYPTTYADKVKAAVDDANESKSKLADLNAKFEEFKKNYDKIVTKYEADITNLQDEIKKGNDAILKASQATNDKFPALQTVLSKLQDDVKKRDEIHITELKDLNDQLARKNIEVDSLKKRIEDRTLGVALGGGGGGGAADTLLHALMLDISRGIPLWDRPLGKIIRLDPANLQVFIDIGSLKGISPEMTFQVFSGTAQGKADKQMKGTIEVIRVIDQNTSVCKITSLFNERGETISLATNEDRLRALRDTESMFREGDLLFNTFFDSHIMIVGNVGFNRVGTDSPATQNMQLQEFTELLRKQHIYVDAYVNLLSGQFEGKLTPRTRLLVKGDFTPLSSSPEETARVKTLREAYAELEKQAISSGMFVISAENFAAVIGYRPPQSALVKESPIGFRPLLPFVNTNDPRFQRPVAGPMADAPMAPPAAKEKE